MICRACLRRGFVPLRAFPYRQFGTTPRLRDPDAGAAPALSTPLSTAGEKQTELSGTKPISVCVAGTTLNGLNYFKGRTDPVALEDNEYPDWLWTCLDVKKTSAAEDENAGDEFSRMKRQRKLAAQRQKKLEKLLQSGDVEALAPKIPLQQQSINLPGSAGGGVEDALHAAAAREELRKAMRKERKAKIKEANYLKSM